MPNLIIGSRGSKLALWQSNWVKQELERLYPGLVVAVEVIQTTGDKLSEASLTAIAGKGAFTKEIEDAVLDRRIDLAVHSLKDLPTTLPDGLHIAAITEREDVRDALIVRDGLLARQGNHGGHGEIESGQLAGFLSGQNRSDEKNQAYEEPKPTNHLKIPVIPVVDSFGSIGDLPKGVRVGTSSLRRRAQLLHLRPDLEIIELRGNVDTRLRKLDEGQYDAIILAAAGLIRLGLADRISARIPANEMLSAVGQGALGIESRIDDQRTNLLLEALNHWPTRFAAEAERAVLRELGGGCAVPIAALGLVTNDRLTLEALVADVNGQQVIRQQLEGSAHQAEELGAQLAEALVQAGARDLLQYGERQRPASSVTDAPFAQTVSPAKPVEVTPESTETHVASEAQVADAPRTVSNAEQPLARRKVIITRSPKQSSEMVRFLEKLGAQVIACPTIEIKPPTSWEQLDRALVHLSWFDWLAFTSANAVEWFLHRLDELGHGRAELMSHRVCAVGRKTAEKLKSENISVDVMPERFTAESLVEEFIKRFGVSQRLRGSRMLLPASKTTRDVIRPAMEKIGVYVEVVEAYQTVLPASASKETMKLIRNANADYIVFTSPSTITNLAAILETDHLIPHLTNCRVACIGPVTADTARLHGLEVHIQPKEHTAEAIVRALAADSLKRLEH
ncbi:MAG: hydroxymethylbilane synthase [Acidobacteriota bacterium]|nr:hydroxymethylbilane synthase [Acidobacteriota bacterium]